MEFDHVFDGFGQGIADLLPLSPFQQFISDFKDLPHLGWLNWFFPVKGCLIIMAAWLSAVGLFYLYSIIMRWIKVIGD